jgi:hypothetical protein
MMAHAPVPAMPTARVERSTGAMIVLVVRRHDAGTDRAAGGDTTSRAAGGHRACTPGDLAERRSMGRSAIADRRPGLPAQ